MPHNGSKGQTHIHGFKSQEPSWKGLLVQKEEYERCGRCLKDNCILTSTFYLLASHPALLREWYDCMKKTKVSILNKICLLILWEFHTLQFEYIHLHPSPNSSQIHPTSLPTPSSMPCFHERKKKSVEFNLYWTCIHSCRVFWTIIKLPGSHTLSKLTLFPEAIVHHSSVRGNASDALMIPLHTRILTGLVLFGSKQTSPVAVNSWRLWPSGVQKALVHS